MFYPSTPISPVLGRQASTGFKHHSTAVATSHYYRIFALIQPCRYGRADVRRVIVHFGVFPWSRREASMEGCSFVAFFYRRAMTLW
jgi:hypothetical protein